MNYLKYWVLSFLISNFLLPIFLSANPTHFTNHSSTHSICTSGIPLTQLPGWDTDHQSDLAQSLLADCQIKKLDSEKKFCAALPSVLASCSPTQNNACEDQHLRVLLSQYFQAVPIVNNSNTGLFTGYYEPTLTGSLTKTPVFNIPIYGKPVGLVELKNIKNIKNNKNSNQETYKILSHGQYQSLPDRASIFQDFSTNHYLPNTPILAWVSSEIDDFFLQIQGSGEILLPNHQSLLVGYAGQNGKKYVPIGSYLIKIGALTTQNISMESIKSWLETHPNQAQRIMNLNPSFVFFRVLNNIQQPIGANGTQLTPYRSLAVDPKYLNLGTPVWLSTYLPMKLNSNIQKGVGFNHLLLAEDTGGAIKGPARGDIYFGGGEDAEWLAGHMQSPGKIWALKPLCA